MFSKQQLARTGQELIRGDRMSDLKERLQGKSAQELFEAADVFDKTNYKIKINRSGDGITISKKGLITFQMNLVDKIGAENLKFLEIRHRFSDDESLLILNVRCELDDVKLQMLEEKGANLKYQDKKRSFNGLGILRSIISEDANQECSDRWIQMFDADASVDLEANSYVFTESDGSLVREQISDGENIFILDIMSGKGNKQEGKKK